MGKSGIHLIVYIL